MGLKKRARGIYEEAPESFIVQVKRRTRRVRGMLADAKRVHAELLLQVEEEQRQAREATSNLGSAGPANSSPCPSLTDWLLGRYAGWQLRAQSERTRRKTANSVRYLIASALADLTLDKIGTGEVNAFVEWLMSNPPLTFATRADGTRRKPRVERLEVIELLIEFGFRPAELFHLPWASVDWTLGEGDNRGAVRVEEQSKTIAGKTWTPKNKRYRTIPFTGRGREILEHLRKLAGKAKPSDLVIPNTSGMPYTRLDDGEAKGGGSEVWRTLKHLSGVQASMRELRHAFAVANLMRGVPIPVVSQWMGHSKVDLTVKRYGRFAHEAREQWHWAALRARPVEEVAQAPRKLAAVQ